MYWIAFTLGFFGSLHCIGMCGPLALAVMSAKGEKGLPAFGNSILYNVGRTISYITLGIAFGLLGSVISLSGTQRIVSISLGVIMVIMSLFSINPDMLINKSSFFRKSFSRLSRVLSKALEKSKRVSPVYLGAVNGLLPCGLVYIAIAGAVSLSNIWGSTGFMLFFGLGTFPAMIGVSLGHQVFNSSLRVSLKKLYPVIAFIMGMYLIYRGILSKLPLELNFFEALNNPVMCH